MKRFLAVTAFAGMAFAGGAVRPVDARADSFPCATGTPTPILPVLLFTPLPGAADVPTNAAIIFQPNITPEQVLIATNGGVLVPAAGTDDFVGELDLFHLTTALRPSTTYQVGILPSGYTTPFVTSTFTTVAAGDTGTPLLSGAVLLSLGQLDTGNSNPECPVSPFYGITASWGEATEAGQSTFVYQVLGSSASGAPAQFASGFQAEQGFLATAAESSVVAGSALNVTVTAFDLAGHASAPITGSLQTPPSPASSSSARRLYGCSVTDGAGGWSGFVCAAGLALVALRLRRRPGVS